MQPVSSLFLDLSAADRNTLLPAQKWGFLLRFQVDEPRVVEGLPLGSLTLRHLAEADTTLPGPR